MDVIPLRWGLNLDDPNPYVAPTSDTELAPIKNRNGTFNRGSKKGPALYIAGFSGMIGFFSVDYLMRGDPTGFIFPTFGAIAGGLIYRIRSRKWPVDPDVRIKQLRYTISILGITFLPAIVSGFMGPGPGLSLMTGVIGIGIIAGIFLSGTRRDGNLKT